MAPWQVLPCTVADADALARNNMCAYWEDPTWILLWPKDMKQEFIVEQCAKRMPRNLLRNREATRHQKAIDPASGAVVGYARWILPSTRTVSEQGEPEWIEGQVPDVSVEERTTFESLASTAWWEPRDDMGGLDAQNTVIRDRILAEKPYIELEYLAVHPENKGKGIGTALVESGIKQAEKMGLDVFTLAFKMGRGIYARLGFKEVDRVIQDDSAFGGLGEYGAYFMVYQCSNK
ncbi:acyl-CoA N-acyltransferase [Hypoxylon sp. NC1633]|nr:acyl-CoA N-acyltransferase [Hypoxylon sp. NC1633]